MDQQTDQHPGAAAPVPAPPLDPEAEIQQARANVNATLGTPPADTTATPPATPAGQPIDVDNATDLERLVLGLPPKKGMLGKLWDYVKPLGNVSDDGRSIVRGVAQGANELSNTAVDLAKGAVKLYDPTGQAAHMVGGMKGQTAYVNWLDANTSKTNPIQFPQDKIDKALGPAKGGVQGLVTGLAQFGTAMLAVPEVEGAGLAVKAGRFAMAQGIGFDPHAQRLSNLLQNSPLANPVSAFLAAKGDDSDALGRLKNSLEGFAVGSVAESVLGTLKYLKAKAAGNTAAADAAAQSAVNAAKTPAATDAVHVTQTPDGKWTVHPPGEIEHPDVVKFDNQADAAQAAISLNYAAKNAHAAVPTLSEAFISRVKELGANPDPRDIQDLMEAHGINYKYINTPDVVINHIKALADVLPVDKSAPVTHAETLQAAGDVFRDMTPEEVVSHAQRLAGDAEKAPAFLTATRVQLWNQGAHLKVLSRLADANPESSFMQDQLAQGLQSLSDLHGAYRGMSSSAGRTLESLKMPIEEATLSTQAQAEALGGEVASNGGEPVAPGPLSVIEGRTPSEIRAMVRMVNLSDGDPAEQLAAINTPKMGTLPADVDPKSFVEKVNGYRMEAMLSGPKTWIAKATADLINLVQRPSEYYWAGVMSNDASLRQFGSDMLVGRWKDTVDSMKAAGKALLNGDNVLVPGKAGIADQSLASTDASGFLQALHVPSRMIMGIDEFSKQMNYRAFVRAEILRGARTEGLSSAQDLADRLESDMPFAFDEAGAGTREQALQYARVGTFTNELDSGGYSSVDGGIGKAMQNLAQKNPVVRLVVPFVRTPVNLFRNVWEHTPVLNRFNAQFQADIEAGGQRAAIAHAKTAFGVATYGTAATLAVAGNLTGAGPRDPEMRELWLQNHQPYSVKLPGTNTWMSYGRMNPSLTAFGMVADVVQMSGDMEGHDTLDQISMITAAIAANMSRQSFNKGIADFTSAAASGDGNKWKKLMLATTQSYVPAILQQDNPDDTLREARANIDKVFGRVPGWSTELEPRRNLFGEKILAPPGLANNTINPFTISKPMSSTSVSDELLKLGKGYAMPPQKIGAGMNVDLTDRDRYLREGDTKRQSPYDRQLELMGKPVDGSPGLREQMEKLVASDEWKNSSDGDSYAPGGIKYLRASAIVAGAQQKAFGQVMQEYPKLATDLGYSAELKGRSLVGGQAGTDSTIAKYSKEFAAPPAAKFPKQ